MKTALAALCVTLTCAAALGAASAAVPIPFLNLNKGKAAVKMSPPPAASTADWLTPDPNTIMVIDTNKGRVIAELVPEIAPQSVERIQTLTRQGFYDGLSFFRVIDDFMDQTGDPNNNGTGGSSLPNLPPEFDFRRSPTSTSFVRAATVDGGEIGFIGPMAVKSQPVALAAISRDGQLSASTPFCAGVLGLARGSTRDSGNSQFYIMRQDSHNLDETYTAFGRVISGLDSARAIKTGEPVPAPQDKMISVKLLADMPEATRPKIKIIDPKGPWFTARLKAGVGDDPSGFDPCSVDIPVLVN